MFEKTAATTQETLKAMFFGLKKRKKRKYSFTGNFSHSAFNI